MFSPRSIDERPKHDLEAFRFPIVALEQRRQGILAETPPRKRLGVNALEGLDLTRPKGPAPQFCVSKCIAPVASVGQGHRDHDAATEHLIIQIASRCLLVFSASAHPIMGVTIVLKAVRATCPALHDGLRRRHIVI